jgi:hypothetical protein
LRGISLLNLVCDKGVFFPGQTDESPSLGIATGLQPNGLPFCFKSQNQ